MNSVQLIGRLTRDPEVRYTQDQMAIATFSIAIDRPPRRDGTRETDFPRITVFGRQAENCEKYLVKGRLVGIEGRIQTGSYTNRNGDKVYTTDVVANRVEFLEWGDRQGQSQGSFGQNRDAFSGQNNFGNQSSYGNQNSFGNQNSYGGNDFGGQHNNADQSFDNRADEQPQKDQSKDNSMPMGFAPLEEDDIPF
ncbi:MAG: single-stranded DNA-binding protein [Anaerovoracaceae bacterium]|nr:single-stranded DNA-binding protein [Anaerovoracaceae bacterium]